MRDCFINRNPYAQRQILAPRNVIEHYSGADKVFQDTIFQQRGIPPMNGYYLIIFTYDNKYGTLSMNLNSTTKGKDSQKELFNGRGKQTVDGQDFNFQILNGKGKFALTSGLLRSISGRLSVNFRSSPINFRWTLGQLPVTSN